MSAIKTFNNDVLASPVIKTLHLYSVWYDNSTSPYSEVSLTADAHLAMDAHSTDLFIDCIRRHIDSSCLTVVTVIYRGTCAKPAPGTDAG